MGHGRRFERSFSLNLEIHVQAHFPRERPLPVPCRWSRILSVCGEPGPTRCPWHRPPVYNSPAMRRSRRKAERKIEKFSTAMLTEFRLCPFDKRTARIVRTIDLLHKILQICPGPNRPAMDKLIYLLVFFPSFSFLLQRTTRAPVYPSWN